MRRLAGWTAMAVAVAACVGGAPAGGDTSSSTTSTVGSTTSSTASSTTSTSTTSTTVASTTTTTVPPSTTTTAPPSTTTTAVRNTTTTAGPTVCASVAPISAAATEVTTVPADVDGDSNLDLMTTFREEETWGLRVDLGAGGAAVTTIDEATALDPVAAIGAFDIEGDGTGELFVKVGSGAYASLIQLFDYADCAITPITLDQLDDTFDGEPAIFAVGASIAFQSGMTCDGSLLWTFDAQLSEDETFYEVMDIPHTLSGTVLTEGFGDGAVVDADEMTGPLFSCGDLTLP